METFVQFCYFASMVVFCAGTVGFIVWDSAALSRWSRPKATPAPETMRQPAGPLAPGLARAVAIPEEPCAQH